MYSQSNEEKIILDYFNGKVGRFLDLGSNDGITFSNTRALAELGWCGVLVEPSPKAFRKLKDLYSDSKKGCFYMYNVAVGSKNGKIDLHESGALLKNGDVGLVSTIIESETDRFKKTVPYEVVQVDCFRWKTFLNRLYIKDFDFISIDIEGAEIEVMKQMDFSKTQLICIETNGSAEKKVILDEMLSEFKVIYTSPENLIYAR
jgi:FkbM family methyltransferase